MAGFRWSSRASNSRIHFATVFMFWTNAALVVPDSLASLRSWRNRATCGSGAGFVRVLSRCAAGQS